MQCANCSKYIAKNRCGGCKSVYYCNIDCQRNHWKIHKLDCSQMKQNKQAMNKAYRVNQIKQSSESSKLNGHIQFHLIDDLDYTDWDSNSGMVKIRLRAVDTSNDDTLFFAESELPKRFTQRDCKGWSWSFARVIVGDNIWIHLHDERTDANGNDIMKHHFLHAKLVFFYNVKNRLQIQQWKWFATDVEAYGRRYNEITDALNLNYGRSCYYFMDNQIIVFTQNYVHRFNFKKRKSEIVCKFYHQYMQDMRKYDNGCDRLKCMIQHHTFQKIQFLKLFMNKNSNISVSNNQDIISVLHNELVDSIEDFRISFILIHEDKPSQMSDFTNHIGIISLTLELLSIYDIPPHQIIINGYFIDSENERIILLINGKDIIELNGWKRGISILRTCIHQFKARLKDKQILCKIQPSLNGNFLFRILYIAEEYDGITSELLVNSQDYSVIHIFKPHRAACGIGERYPSQLRLWNNQNIFSLDTTSFTSKCIHYQHVSSTALLQFMEEVIFDSTISHLRAMHRVQVTQNIHKICLNCIIEIIIKTNKFQSIQNIIGVSYQLAFTRSTDAIVWFIIGMILRLLRRVLCTKRVLKLFCSKSENVKLIFKLMALHCDPEVINWFLCDENRRVVYGNAVALFNLILPFMNRNHFQILSSEFKCMEYLCNIIQQDFFCNNKAGQITLNTIIFLFRIYKYKYCRIMKRNQLETIRKSLSALNVSFRLNEKISMKDIRKNMKMSICFNFKCKKNTKNECSGLKMCKGCKIALYCSEKCQKYHWKYGHSIQCKWLQSN
eukprot:70145_1